MRTNTIKQLNASTDDLIEYKNTLSRNKIFRFWLEICRTMPKSLYNELKQKQTTLELRNIITENGVTYNLYHFVTSGAGPKLKEYLQQFIISIVQS